MQETLNLVTSFVTLGGIVFLVYRFFRDPDVDIKSKVDLMQQACDFRHKSLDDNILLIKENHLKHIEKSLNDLQMNYVRMTAHLESMNEFIQTLKK